MYLSTTALQISTKFSPDFYKMIGEDKFKYSYIELYDDEVNYKWDSETIVSLPVLDVSNFDLNYQLENFGKNSKYEIITIPENIYINNNTAIQITLSTNVINENYVVSVVKSKLYDVSVSLESDGTFTNSVETENNNFYIKQMTVKENKLTPLARVLVIGKTSGAKKILEVKI